MEGSKISTLTHSLSPTHTYTHSLSHMHTHSLTHTAGQGLTPEHCASLFHPYVQIDAGENQDGKGTGLVGSVMKWVVRCSVV
jgi:hypothetical protein